MEEQLSLFDNKTFAPSSKKATPKPPSPPSAPRKKELPSSSWHIYIDGASRGNPGPAGAGIYIRSNNHIIIKEGIYLGKKTNNQAEYLALALSLFFIKKQLTHVAQFPELFFHSDSLLLVQQLNGVYKIKNATLHKLYNTIVAQLHPFTYRFTHVYREENTHADKLANEGIDKKKKMPTDFVKFLAQCNLTLEDAE